MEQLDTDQVTKAVVALKQFLKKKKAQTSKQALVDENNTIQIIFTRVTVPVKESLKAIPIKLPHNIRGDGEACLFVKDSDKDRIKAHLKADPVAGLAKVMPLKKLKKNFSQFKDKRELKAAYGVFLVDDRVLPYVKSLLGKTFFDAKKQPTTVNVTGKKNISDHIRRVLDGTEMFTSPGPCFNVKIAHDGMDTDHIVANIVQGTKNILEHVPKKWKNIKSINIKTSDSVALPIYNALPNSSKLPIGSKKRKAEDSDAQPSKKAKASEAKTAETPAVSVATPAPKNVTADTKVIEKPAGKADVTKASSAKKVSTPVKAVATKVSPAKKASKPVKAETVVKASPSTKKATPVKPSPAKKEAAPTKEAPLKKEAVKSVKTTTPPTKKSPAKKVSATKK
ncbi:hypothetical protein H310_14853 [Aphanomyces invadans]|uniref:Ribosomal protein L1 n=1 Tax=Aphanomyces invadans TaxID=157072 RepID=A0A024T8J5_9STRA|nr:hypothetical protein H310_14853 [Aphanomyces invadans]ETV90343.1 hypothetical protein H310_14853 [Aphanomyces invadans]|eukprot:XP_008881017.1 hypothetical protein H310_14853 [Aphanomyces invadans]